MNCFEQKHLRVRLREAGTICKFWEALSQLRRLVSCPGIEPYEGRSTRASIEVDAHKCLRLGTDTDAIHIYVVCPRLLGPLHERLVRKLDIRSGILEGYVVFAIIKLIRQLDWLRQQLSVSHQATLKCRGSQVEG